MYEQIGKGGGGKQGIKELLAIWSGQNQWLRVWFIPIRDMLQMKKGAMLAHFSWNIKTCTRRAYTNHGYVFCLSKHHILQGQESWGTPSAHRSRESKILHMKTKEWYQTVTTKTPRQTTVSNTTLPTSSTRKVSKLFNSQNTANITNSEAMRANVNMHTSQASKLSISLSPWI